MKRFLRNLFAGPKTQSAPTSHRTTMNLEALQGRLCPAVYVAMGASVNAVGTLSITSDAASDKVVVTSAAW